MPFFGCSLMIPTFFFCGFCLFWLVGWLVCLSKSGPSGGELWAPRCDLVWVFRADREINVGVIFWPQKPIR